MSSLNGLRIDLSNLKNKLVHNSEHYPSKFATMGFASHRRQPNPRSMDEDDDSVNKEARFQ
jgi:hypothetical protein